MHSRGGLSLAGAGVSKRALGADRCVVKGVVASVTGDDDCRQGDRTVPGVVKAKKSSTLNITFSYLNNFLM